jgi:hypothetical protein
MTLINLDKQALDNWIIGDPDKIVCNCGWTGSVDDCYEVYHQKTDDWTVFCPVCREEL